MTVALNDEAKLFLSILNFTSFQPNCFFINFTILYQNKIFRGGKRGALKCCLQRLHSHKFFVLGKIQPFNKVATWIDSNDRQ